MKLSDTISVNPGKTTLGEIDKTTALLFRNPVLSAEQTANKIGLLSLLFPTDKAGTSEYRKYSMPLRTLFATILIVSGLTMLSFPFGMNDLGCAICTLVFGAFLALGLFVRPVMAGASIYYCIFGALALREGITDITVFSLMFGCLIFCVIGAGKYSCDMLIRRALIRHRKASESKRKDNLMSYKAFHNIGC